MHGYSVITLASLALKTSSETKIQGGCVCMVIFETVTQAQNNIVFGTKFCVVVSFHFPEEVLRSLQTVYLPLFLFLQAKCLPIRHLAADTGLLPLVTHKCSGQVGLANRSSKGYTRFSAKFSLNLFWALIGEVRLFDPGVHYFNVNQPPKSLLHHFSILRLVMV